MKKQYSTVLLSIEVFDSLDVLTYSISTINDEYYFDISNDFFIN